jgi:hypothetical protein
MVEGSGEGGIHDLLSGTVKAVISNRGLAGCGSVTVGVDPFSVTVSGGAGIRWNPSLILGPAAIFANLHLFLGCDLSSYETVVAPHDARAAAAGTRVFTVKPGEKLLALAVQGLGAAPKVALAGPHGVSVDLSGTAADVKTSRGLGIRSDAESKSFFLVAHPPAGTWEVIPAADSAPVAAIQRAELLPQPHIRARVIGRGLERTLRYSVTPIKGQVVRFVEQGVRGGQQLATVRTGGSGMRRFVPAFAHGTRRRIVAEVEQNGLPRTTITVATFSAPSPHVGRVAHLRVRRRGGSAVISWGRAFYATRYDVVASYTTGARVLVTPRRGRRSLKLKLARSAGMTVRVVGVSGSGLHGHAAVAQLAAPAQAKPKPKPKSTQHRRHRKGKK